MQYLLLIYGDEARFEGQKEADRNAILNEFMQFTKDIVESGNYKGGNELKPVATATTVRIRDKKRLVTDGPFAETKEQLGGFYLVEADDLNAALAHGSRPADVYYQLARLSLAQNDRAAASDWVKKSLAADPHNDGATALEKELATSK